MKKRAFGVKIVEQSKKRKKYSHLIGRNLRGFGVSEREHFESGWRNQQSTTASPLGRELKEFRILGREIG